MLNPVTDTTKKESKKKKKTKSKHRQEKGKRLLNAVKEKAKALFLSM